MSFTDTMIDSLIYPTPKSIKHCNQAKVRFICPIQEKMKFQHSSCVISVSLNNPVQTGYKFINTLQKAIDTFESVNIMLADSLQAHNISLKNHIPIKEARQLATILGDEWLIRHRAHMPEHIYEGIIRFDELLTNPKLQNSSDVITNYYKDNSYFYSAVNIAASIFAERKLQSGRIKCDIKSAINASINYILEECAALLVLQSYKFNYEIYPSARIVPMEMIHNKFIEPTDNTVLKEVSLEIKTRHKIQMPAEAL